MQNPWLSILLSDYEGHMSLPEVAQAGMLSREFEVLVRQYVPESVAILGCSGGGGFDRISPNVTSRVVGVDINAAYIETARPDFWGNFALLSCTPAICKPQRCDSILSICSALRPCLSIWI